MIIVLRNTLTLLVYFMVTFSYADILGVLPKCSDLKHEKKVAFIDPLEPREQMEQEVGYSCKIATKPTRNYKNNGEVKWTLLAKRGGGKKIWTVDTPGLGKIVVSYIEQGLYNHSDGLEICNKVEKFSINGEEKEVLMELPTIGFRHGGLGNPLSFELLFYLNYHSVSPISPFKYTKFWSNTPGYMHHMRLLTSLDGDTSSTVTKYEASIRCVGRLD